MSSDAARVVARWSPAHAGRTHGRLSFAADPLRPSAGGASPDVATSDILCRPVGAARELRSRVRHDKPLSFVRRMPHPTVPGPARRRPVRDDDVLSPGCLPPVRSRPHDRAKPSAFPVTFARKPSHPFARSVRSRLVKTSRRSALLRVVLVRLAASSMARTRCFWPTSATDSRHEHPWIARFPGALHVETCGADRMVLPRPRSGSPVRRRTAFRRSHPGWARA